MPVTFTVSSHPAKPLGLTHEYTATEILAAACQDQCRYVEEVLQFGFSSEVDVACARDGTTTIPHIFPDSQGNGFVNTVLDAYNQHRALVIRPDDVWLTIISQFSLFMVDLIEKNVVDPTLREWAMPGFTTTTDNDTTVAAVLMMATLKEYFTLEKLKEYGIETIAWYYLLHPVISAFTNAFDAPESEENVDFWQTVARYPRLNMSGGSPYSGWINAFTVFSKKGAWLGHRLDKTMAPEVPPEELTAEQFWATYSKLDAQSLHQTPYHHMRHEDIPPAYAEVDVKVVDNGQELNCFMLAGVVGTCISSSEDLTVSSTGKDDTAQPAAGWWLCTKKENVVSAKEESEARMKETRREMEEILRKWDLQREASLVK
ncbi:hypothetical protein MVEN_01832100 [Mycena venus]|uniref:Uncharacterized protein n=1 Tax=Mycena venus TaxID=2733690 RepID=A0A8H7CLT0_9AGAR|nr:hypothetical protein MVEN_01832100 [Mycena venus]